jgi:tetratricopeptide (TPR) repeat protein
VKQGTSKWFSLMIEVVILSSMLVAASDYRHDGDSHFYNLEYDQAITDYTKLIQQNPEDPIPYNDLASAQMNKEMSRLGLLDSNALGRDNRFLRIGRPQPDPGVRALIFDTLDRGRRKAETALVREPRNTLGLYSLCTNYGLRATYEFMVERAWVAALRDGSKAHSYCAQAQKSEPGFIDAYLILGIYEYAAGCLPLPVRLLAGGLHGSKKKGIEYVNRVAENGKYDRTAARVLLGVLYRRENRPLEAAGVLQSLIADYPQNYLFSLELASMYSDAGQPELALSTLRSLLQRAEENTSSYRSLPKAAVQRRIELIEARRLPLRRASAT